MTKLTIRNLTINAIELVSVERFESQKIATGNVFRNVSSAITGFLNATTVTCHEVHPKGDGQDKLDVSLTVQPFQAVETDVRTADASGHEVIRLTFAVAGYSYETHVPSPSRKSSVMKKLGPEEGPHELTTIYSAGDALLAVFSSARLDGWMRELDDAWPLSLLSIPGTHNSPTCHTALPSVRCQSAGVPEQLRNGARFLDIRVSVSPDDSRLALVHSAFPVSLTGSKWFGDMLAGVYAFLDENPGEAVLMSIKREGTGRGSDDDLARWLKRDYVDVKPERWWTDAEMPVLGRARGRIVLIRRFGGSNAMEGHGWGIDASVWPDNCQDGLVGGDGRQLRVQDFYEVTESDNIDKKLAFATAQLERAAQQEFGIPGMPEYRADAVTPPLFVNFLSASNFFNAACWPERIAAKINPAIIAYLCARHGEKGKGPAELPVGLAATGVVVTDWVGANGDWDLIRCIVGMNARLQSAGMEMKASTELRN